MLILGREDLVRNKQFINSLLMVSDEYSADAVDKIIRKIATLKKHSDANCNEQMLKDNLLLYILEEKYYAKN